MVIRVVIYFVIFLLLNIPCIIFCRKEIKSDYDIGNTMSTLNKLGSTQSYIAPIRFGKTSGVMGIKHMYELDIQNKIYAEMKKISNKLYMIDFNDFDMYLRYCMNKKTSYFDVIGIVEKYIEIYKITDGIINDFLSNSTIHNLLGTYADDYRILHFRRNYVMSKTFAYSHITHSSAKMLIDKTLQIKEVCNHNIFYVERWVLIIEDEVSIDDGNEKSNVKSETTKGKKEFKVLFGQLFEETSKYISIKQIAKDEVAKNRRLTQSNMQMIKRFFSNNKKEFYIYIYFLEKCCLIKEKIKYFFKKWFVFKMKKYWRMSFDEYKMRNDNNVRFKLDKYELLRSYLFSLQNNNILMREYSSADDVGKVDEKYYNEFLLTLPLKWCYGTYTNHEYFYVLKMLHKMTKYNFGDIPNVKFRKNGIQEQMQSKFIFEKEVEKG